MKKVSLCLFVFTALLQWSCTKEGKGFVNSSGKGGSLARFTIVGNYLYTVDRSQLKVFDISQTPKALLTSTEDVGFEIETIFPFKDKLFIGSTSVVHIFSIEDPQHPKKLSTAISPTVMRRCDPVVAKDSVAYTTLRTNGICGGVRSILAVFDIKNIENPVEVYQYPVNEPYGLGYADSALYVCDKSSLLVFNISRPYEPQLVTQINENEFFDVIAENNTLVCWVKQGIVLFDISNRLDPKLITKIQ
ncbi:MAG: hypothetical protein JNK79_18505 [Chitinophagaceae bacterium]|nr:hypothetical protein [Chitinophagaceae bacterium]